MLIVILERDYGKTMRNCVKELSGVLLLLQPVFIMALFCSVTAMSSAQVDLQLIYSAAVASRGAEGGRDLLQYRTMESKLNIYSDIGNYFDVSVAVLDRISKGVSTSVVKPVEGVIDIEVDSDGDLLGGGQEAVIRATANTNTPILLHSGVEVCDNGVDDDGDGLIDCEDPDCLGNKMCAPKFACDNSLYQTIKVGGDYWLYRVEISPVSLTPLVNLTDAGVSGDVNSTMLNPQDGYIYMLKLSPDFRMYRISADFQVLDLGASSGPGGLWYINAGAVDKNGNWIVRDASSKRFLSIDIDTRVLTELCDFSSASPNGNIGDFEYNPVDGYYYGVLDNSNSLIQYDFATCTRNVLSLSSTISSAFGAFWISADGIGYGYENWTGNLKRVNLQTGVVSYVGTGATTGSTDGCSCQGVKLDKDALLRTVHKGSVNTYEFTVYNRYFTNLQGATFRDDLPAGARWVKGPYDMSGGLAFETPVGVGTSSITVTASNVPQTVTSFKMDYLVDPSYAGVHPMPNQAYFSDLPVGIGVVIQSDDPMTASIRDPTYVSFFEHCSNGVDDDVDGDIDCEDEECPGAPAILRISLD